MANIASSKKDARRSAVRAVRNRGLKSSVKTKVVKVRRAIAEGGEEALAELGAVAIAALDRAAAKGVLHRNNAARRKSRLMKRLAAAGTGAAAPAKTATKAAPKRSAPTKAKAAAKKPAASKPAAKKPAAKKK
ncbi:MAG: 30S ribosomal protein S20 [Chloroflexota bacterium]